MAHSEKIRVALFNFRMHYENKYGINKRWMPKNLNRVGKN